MKRQWILITAMALTLAIAAVMSGCGSAKTETAIPAAAPQSAAAAVAVVKAGDNAHVDTYPLGIPVSGPPLFESGLWPQGKSVSQTPTVTVVDGSIQLATYPLGVNPSGLPLVEAGLWPSGAAYISLPIPSALPSQATVTPAAAVPGFINTYPLGVNPSGWPLFDGWQPWQH
jgi:uncharacterized protein YceK